MQFARIQKVATETPHEELTDAIDREFEDMETSAQSFGGWESVRIESLVSRIIWVAGGVSALIWIAGPNACPLCQQLDGTKVAADGAFVGADDQIGDFAPGRTVTTPPLHMG